MNAWRHEGGNWDMFVRLICVSILLGVGSAACNSANRGIDSSGAEAASEEAPPQGKTVLSGVPIPADVTYTIIDTDVMRGIRTGRLIKRSIDVRLNRKVEEEVLRSIALELQTVDPRYERTFITYYLPEMEVGAGAWATTHFDPNLEVRILGMTGRQELAVTREPMDRGLETARDTGLETIGSWLNETPFTGGKLTIYREDSKLYMEHRFKDGSSVNREIVEKRSSNGRRFEQRGGANFGEYYILDRQGNLQIRDREGLITTARKIRR